MNSGKTAGALLFVGAAQFVIALVIAETLYGGYSVGANVISDLGVGPNGSALVFNASIIVFGALTVAATYFLWKEYGKRELLFPALVLLSGLGTAGVGVFTERAGAIHAVVAFIAFFFGAVAALAAYRHEEKPLKYFSVVLGLTALVALALYGTKTFLGLGPGGMERMIAYPILLWALGFGGTLLAKK